MNRKIAAIDAFSLIYKAYFGVRNMNASDGTPTNAIYGFFSMLIKLISNEKPDYIFVAFDSGKEKTFRTELYSEYKGTRDAAPEGLIAQLPLIVDILEKANITMLAVEGLEADDLLGYLSLVGDEAGDKTLLVTGDRDLYQLASESTSVMYSKKGVSDTIIITPEYIKGEYGLEPKQLIDVKALMGDASDNIPGVKGIGEKTALSLIQKYGSLDSVYENLSSVQGKVQEKLTFGKESAYLSRALAEIKRDAPISIDYEKAQNAGFGNNNVYEALSRLQLANLIKLVGYIPPQPSAPPKAEGKTAQTPQKLESLPDGAFSEEPSSFALEEANGQYILGVANESGLFFTFSKSLESFREYFESPQKKASHGLKNIYKTLDKSGIVLNGAYIDLEIAAYILSSGDGRYSLSDLAHKYLGEQAPDPAPSAKQMSFLDDSAFDEAKYSEAAKKAGLISRIASELETKLRDDGLWDLYSAIEHPLIKVLAEMEERGFSIDSAALSSLEAEFSKRSALLASEILAIAGKSESFNLNSSKQLGSLLFEELGLPTVKKTKTGYSTDSEVLEKLEGMHPIIKPIIELRAVNKLESTFITGLLKLIDNETGKIHTSFNQSKATTGRLSSSNPNLQNIPTRTQDGRIIRKAFVASSESCLLLDADYSQIELRVLAHITGDNALINAFHEGLDIHLRTASEVFGVPIGEVTKDMRSAAKAVNFGIVYGISDFGLSKGLGISKSQAKTYIERYLERFEGVKAYMAEIVEKARFNGYVETMFHRRCYLPDITSRNFAQRSFAERVALNAPIQGAAADIIKIAMVKVSDRLNREGLEAKLILQVHDELIVDCPPNEAGKASEILKFEMENAAALSVPLICEVGIAHDWFSAK